jgi:hypothetical protein
MASLEDIIKDLKDEVSKSGKISNRILKIKGLKRLVIQINAVPTNNNVRISMTIHPQNNYKKQLGITTEDYNDLVTIAEFLNKYKDVLDKYIRYTRVSNNNEMEIEVEKENTSSSSRREKRDIEDEF